MDTQTQQADQVGIPYEAWRITYQSSEQAARAAYSAWRGAATNQTELEALLALADARINKQVDELRAAQHAASAQGKDVQIVDFLAKQYIGPDFRWGDPATEVIVIEMPKGCGYCGDFRADVAGALAAQAKQGG